jgi:predicted nucleotidyltransferase
MNAIIENNKNQIIELCKQHEVKELYVFGSVVRDDFNDESDVDFLAAFNFQPNPENIKELEKYFTNQDELAENLKQILKRDVDLLIEKNIRNKYLRYLISKEKKLIYAAA